MCDEFKKNQELQDTPRITLVYEKYLYPFLQKQEAEEVDSIAGSIFYRLQRSCEEFRFVLNKLNPPKNDSWVILKEKPLSKITKSELEEFKKISKFFYFEQDGNQTNVEFFRDFYQDTFFDKTYSKLNLKWLNSNSFQLTFVESTNEMRKSFSKKGDQYNYQIISKEDGYYWITVEIPNQNDIYMFKLFILK